jgi:hypothetical protein
LNAENRIKPRKIRQAMRVGYLEKITPSIPKNEDILNIELKIEAFERILGIICIPVFIIIFYILVLGIENSYNAPFTHFTWSSLTLVIGILLEIYFVLVRKGGYDIMTIVFTNKRIYFFDNEMKVGGSAKYSEVKNVFFDQYYSYGQSKNFLIHLEYFTQTKSTKDSLKFMYFLLYNYCNPKVQIKNILKDKSVLNIEDEFQKVIQKSIFNISNERYTDIHKKKEGLLIKIISYMAITVVVTILIVSFIHNELSASIEYAILYDVIVLIFGFVILYSIPYTGNQIYSSLKRVNYLPNSNFEICPDGIKVMSPSGEALIPFEDELIINPYDCIVKFFVYSGNRIYDGIQFSKFNEKEIKFQVGPVEDHEFFYLLTLNNYLNWLNENKLILNEEYVKEHYLLSDQFKKSIAEKIMSNEEVIEAIDVPAILDMPSFTIESEKAVFKYPKDLYKYYISDDEKIYYIHQQVAIPPTIRRKFSFQIFFISLLGLTSLLLFLGLQNEPTDILLLFILPLIPIFWIGYLFFKTILSLKKIKNTEAIFTESKIVFKRKNWIYPLSYDDINYVHKTFENSRKRYYKFLHFHSIKKAYLMTLHDIGFDNPMITILNAKCKVK